MQLSSFLKLFIFLIVFSGFYPLHAQELEDHIDEFYQRYTIQGEVMYSQLSADSRSLDLIIQRLKTTPWEELGAEDRQAFLINAYNIFVIKGIVDRYPVSSPKAIQGFFSKKRYRLSKQIYSLDNIEKDLLFGLKRDPRFHLALNCGAKSCPPLWPKALRGLILEKQLESISRNAINSVWLPTNKNEILLSEIFSWYSYDFGNLTEFINRYRIDKIEPPHKIVFSDYDWSLNEYLTDGKIQQPFLTASQLMQVGTWEIKAFQSAYVQVNQDGFSRDNSRSTFFSNYNQLLIGLKPGLNIGLDVVWKKNNLNDLPRNSWLNTFTQKPINEQLLLNCTDSDVNFPDNSSCITDSTVTQAIHSMADGTSLTHEVRQGLAHLGPKIKFRIFKKIPKLTTQQTFYIPIVKKVDGQWISFTQFFYDQRLGSKGSLFAEISFWTPIHPEFKVNTFTKSFWSFFPNRYLSIYGMLAIPGEYGAGLKINLTRRLELELLATRYLSIERFFGDRRAGTFNIGLRVHP